MAYTPTTDFVGLWRAVSGGVAKVEMPGLDFVIAALGRSGAITLSTSTTAPVVNQAVTAWFQPAGTSYAAEGAFFLWNAVAASYQPASPRLLLEMFAAAEKVATVPTAISSLLDTLLGTQGAIAFRGSANWQGLAPGAIGQVLVSGGPGANPAWAALSSTTAPLADSSTAVATTAFLTQSGVRADMAQALNASQELQARINIGAAAPAPPCGRLTLQSATPVMTSTQAAKTTLFWTPYKGNQIPFFDGTNWTSLRSAEISVAIADTTKNPAAIGASKVNDWFLWNDGGTLRLSHGPDWTNDTTRSAGTALQLQDGIWMNAVTITNACAALRGVYVGTTRSNAGSTLDWIFGLAQATAGAASLYVWNMYNRVLAQSGQIQDTSATWSYTSATVRQFNGSANNRCNFVSGLAEDAPIANLALRVLFGASAGQSFQIGVGLDATNAYFAGISPFAIGGVVGNQQTLNAPNVLPPQLGAHFIAANENSDGTNAATLVGTNSGLQVSLLM